jgi:multisubunit Na+/H+ antiporter MnhF subunit
MEASTHPAAIDHLPMFITAPGGTDYLFNVMAVFLIVILLLVGNFYLRLHSLPEQMAHGASKVQLQLVGVLGLLALFTHNHLFWVAALLIALVPIPDFSRPLFSMAESLERIAAGPLPRPPTPPDEPPVVDAAAAPAVTETKG